MMKTEAGWKALFAFRKLQAEHEEMEAMDKKNQNPVEDSQKNSDGQNHPTLNQVAWHNSIHKTHPSLRIREIIDVLIVKYGREARVKDVIDQIYDEAYRDYEEGLNGGKEG